MKLRNKKTGEVEEFNEIYLTKTVKETNTATSEYVERSYYGIDELNEEWENYKPAEPLINDEKIRKAVRAWAEANGLNAQPIYFSAEYNRFCDAPDFSIAIDFYREVKGGPHDGYSYYLGELCGRKNESR